MEEAEKEVDNKLEEIDQLICYSIGIFEAEDKTEDELKFLMSGKDYELYTTISNIKYLLDNLRR